MPVKPDDAPSDWTKHTNDLHFSVAGASPRLLFEDTMLDTTPSSVTTSGQWTQDATRGCYNLGGTSVSSYVTPSFACNGFLTIEVVHENIANLTNNIFSVQTIRDTSSTNPCSCKYQNDTNMVVYVDQGAGLVALAASGTTTGATTHVADATAHLNKTVVSIADTKMCQQSMGIHMYAAPWAAATTNTGHRGFAGARGAHSLTQNAGDLFHWKLEALGTRKVGLYLVRIWNGPVMP